MGDENDFTIELPDSVDLDLSNQSPYYVSSNSPTFSINSVTTSTDMDFGTVDWGGNTTSIENRLDKIEKRLSILVPDPEKIEKFEALKKAYEHYKTLESLCELEEENDHDGSIDY
jgi:hypothetical protein